MNPSEEETAGQSKVREEAASARTPDFIYAGMPKAGSTWLYEALRSHPDVFVPDSKGLDFFDRNYDRGRDWYLGHFAAATHARVVGEISHDTYACAEAPQRILESFPDMRVILCLREPGEAARSILQWWMTHTHAFGADVPSMTAHPHYRALLSYRDNLQRFVDVFPRSHLLVLFFEDLARDPRTFLDDVLQFVGLGRGFLPPVLDQKVNASREPRSAAFARLTYRAGGLLRTLGAGQLVERAKASPIVQSLLYGDGEGAVPRDEIRTAMVAARRAVSRDHAVIATIAGRPVPPEWAALANSA